MTLKSYLYSISLVVAAQLCCNVSHAQELEHEAKTPSLEGLDVNAPTEEKQFVTRIGDVDAIEGLNGCNIALWQSHGWYFEPKLNRWEWQRARIFQTVEDLYAQSYVMPFLMPMLENAGAYVMSPRERDTNSVEIIIDNDGGYAKGEYSEHNDENKWKDTGEEGFGYKKEVLKNGDNPFRDGTARMVEATTDSKISTASWSANIPKAGEYAVYVSYQTLDNSATDVVYTVNTAGGSKQFAVNQKMGGGTWIYLGHFPFEKGTHKIVELSNKSQEEGVVVTADAVKIGGGMGNVARIVKEPLDAIDYDYVSSGYPRFTEGARYWMQWAGIPKSVYSLSDNVNDYTDDYKSRGEWVNYLAGGSSVLPDREGLNIPVDLAFAFHTDAGTKMDDTIVGTLGIYCTDGGKKYANGTDRQVSGVFTDMIMTQIVDDIRKQYEPKWTRRDMWNKSYYEARVPEVPSMLLELLSHQNFADMKYGLDPTFRFAVSRSIYKGMLKFLAERDQTTYAVQPLAVSSMAIVNEGDGKYRLTWKATVDSLEETAIPFRYIVEERIGNGAFRKVGDVETESWDIEVKDDEVRSYRVIAVNTGGKSFPSEVLALCHMENKKPVLVVNGFTRVSGPDTFDSGEIAGFYDSRDHGVPYIKDISYIGSMFEFRRDIPWMDDDAAGFGASRANYETKVIAGNTFDYVATHGEAIKEAGYPFISMSLDAYIANGTPDGCQVVDLILGKQKEIKVGRGAYGTRYKSFPAGLQQRLSEHANQGGNLFVSGAFIATDLWDNRFSDKATLASDQKFASSILGYKWRVGQASVTGEAYQVATRYKAFGKGDYKFNNTLNEDCYIVESPDSFYPADDKTGATFMRYSENNLIAGTVMDNGTHKAVCLGFPFETIKSEKKRNQLMKQVLEHFSGSRAEKSEK